MRILLSSTMLAFIAMLVFLIIISPPATSIYFVHRGGHEVIVQPFFYSPYLSDLILLIFSIFMTFLSHYYKSQNECKLLSEVSMFLAGLGFTYILGPYFYFGKVEHYTNGSDLTYYISENLLNTLMLIAVLSFIFIVTKSKSICFFLLVSFLIAMPLQMYFEIAQPYGLQLPKGVLIASAMLLLKIISVFLLLFFIVSLRVRIYSLVRIPIAVLFICLSIVLLFNMIYLV